jgi:3-oxosteroid 1-dehydrogenase
MALARTVATFNADAQRGVDRAFDRGGCDYDRYFADPGITPNGSLAPLVAAPFYAVRLELGDIGTKGGLLTDAQSRVLDTEGNVIAGLYAAGNTAASIFGDAYPGASGTLAPAMTAHS